MYIEITCSKVYQAWQFKIPRNELEFRSSLFYEINFKSKICTSLDENLRKLNILKIFFVFLISKKVLNRF